MSQKGLKKNEKRMKLQTKVMDKNIKGIPTNKFEEKIAHRGLGAGYFCIDIEVIKNYSPKEKAIYKHAEDKGIKNLEQSITTQEDFEEYIKCKRDYLRNLGDLAFKEEIEVNTSSLTSEELKYFEEGYSLAVIRGLTPKEVIAEYKKEKQRVRK